MPKAANLPRVIAVAGNIGAGKSTLVGWLERQFEMVPFFEPNDENPYLADFYGDMKRWALSSQLFFLVKRFQIHKQIDERALREGKHIAVDRTIYEDAEIFAEYLHEKGNIDDRDFAMYRDLYGTLRKEIRPPDLMIFLKCPVATIMKRIKRRGRAFEQKIPRTYLADLDRLYERWFSRYTESESIVIETDRLDYLEHLFDRHELIALIEKHLAG